MQPDRLYHFTCAHGAKRIGRYNCLIIPQIEHPLLRIRVSWFTTEAEADRERTGLTMDRLRCDRMQFRYVITDLSGCRPWLGSAWRKGALKHGTPGAVTTLESYGDPEHWWIAACPIVASFDSRYDQTVA